MRALTVLVLLGACTEPSYLGKPLSSWRMELDDPNVHTRRNACDAMAELGPQAAPAVPQLVRLLDDPNDGIQGLAAIALAKVGDPARQQISTMLGRHEPDVRLGAARAMLEIDPGHGEAQDILVKTVVGVGNVDLALQAKRYAARTSADLTPLLLPFLEDPFAPVRMQAVKTLHAMGKKARAGVPALKGRIDDPDVEIRVAAITAMAEIGPREAVQEFFEGLLKDPVETVADHAGSMLLYIGARKSASGYGDPKEETEVDKAAP